MQQKKFALEKLFLSFTRLDASRCSKKALFACFVYLSCNFPLITFSIVVKEVSKEETRTARNLVGYLAAVAF